MKLMIFVFATILLVGCGHTKISPDSEITPDWIVSPTLNQAEKISREEAQAFVKDFFDIFHQVVFDPAYRSQDVKNLERSMQEEILRTPVLTRALVTDLLNKNTKSIKFSHFAVLDPAKTKMIMTMSGEGETEAKPAVSARRIGEVGVIKVSSFLVPSVTKRQLREAKEKVKRAKFLIYDLRDNGGGSLSSNGYLIDSLIGPGKTYQFSRDRIGMAIADPVVRTGYFPDEENYGSKADIDFESKRHYVEWKTDSGAVRDERPAAVIVNGKCGSSCDAFAAAVKEYGAALLVGTRTAGAVLGAVAYKLRWRGYTAVMPVSQLISPRGNLYEGIGIEPEVEIKSCAAPGDKCVREAIRFLRKRSFKKL